MDTIRRKADNSGSEGSSSVEDRVSLALREMLMHGEFLPGQKLVEAALAERLGVSRMPVRRALAVLERDGLVTNLPNRGSYVARFTVRQVNDARELRGSLEGLAARLVAERGLAPATQLALEEMLEQTDCPHARWHVVSAESKRHARVEAMRLVIAEIEAGMRRWGQEPLGTA